MMMICELLVVMLSWGPLFMIDAGLVMASGLRQSGCRLLARVHAHQSGGQRLSVRAVKGLLLVAVGQLEWGLVVGRQEVVGRLGEAAHQNGPLGGGLASVLGPAFLEHQQLLGGRLRARSHTCPMVQVGGHAHRVGLASGGGGGSGRGGGGHTHLLVVLLHLFEVHLVLAFHGNAFANVANACVLEQRGEHHDETGAQKDVDGLDVGDLGQGSVCARH